MKPIGMDSVNPTALREATLARLRQPSRYRNNTIQRVPKGSPGSFPKLTPSDIPVDMAKIREFFRNNPFKVK